MKSVEKKILAAMNKECKKREKTASNLNESIKAKLKESLTQNTVVTGDTASNQISRTRQSNVKKEGFYNFKSMLLRSVESQGVVQQKKANKHTKKRAKSVRTKK
uniref:Uncharacterized protein n=1 Tax=Bombyx mori TaxID=7091 RepID=A0A8R2HSG1_BOMMO|nr:uncharacterized protein LOC110386107 [Bombyx mori]